MIETCSILKKKLIKFMVVDGSTYVIIDLMLMYLWIFYEI